MDALGLKLIGHTDLNGQGDAMTLSYEGEYVYVAHIGVGEMATSGLQIRGPAAPAVVHEDSISLSGTTRGIGLCP